jgi:hypothetical protein
MLLPSLSLTYLGTVFFYAASPSSPPYAVEPIRALVPAGPLRAVGGLVLGAGLVLAVLGGPVAEGLLIWLSMAIASCSFVAITAPLARRLLPATAFLALAAAAMAPWM